MSQQVELTVYDPRYRSRVLVTHRLDAGEATGLVAVYEALGYTGFLTITEDPGGREAEVDAA